MQTIIDVLERAGRERGPDAALHLPAALAPDACDAIRRADMQALLELCNAPEIVSCMVSAPDHEPEPEDVPDELPDDPDRQAPEAA